MTQRTDGKIAGTAYLSYIALAMSSVFLSAKMASGNDLPQALSAISSHMDIARATVLLNLLQIVCAFVLAATLYQLVKAVDPTVALLAMLFRVGEGVLGFLPLLDKLELMQLATTPAAAASALKEPAVLYQIVHRPNNGFSEFCFIVGGFLFACLFLRGRLVPTWLAWIGVVTIGAQLICIPLGIATVVPSPVVNWLWFPILFYEVPLGIWLIAKGTRRSELATSSLS